MAATRTIQISALNIAMHHPHSPQRYVDLFKEAKRLKFLVPLGSLHAALLGSLYGPTSGSNGYLTGEVYRFVKLNTEEPWFNLETSDVASEEDVDAIKIPPHLLPHLQRIEFVFKPREHELWFVSRDRKDRLGPQAAAKFFQTLFDQLVARGRFPEVEVTPIPDADTLDEMFSLPVLERIVIQLKRPNADDAASEEAKWLKRLEKQKVRKQTTELFSAPGASIEPDAETRALATVASRNGNVAVVGRDSAGLRVEDSTQARPLVITERVDSDNETSIDVLIRTAMN